MHRKGKVYRLQTDRVVAGVFGGLGAYFDVDPVVLRLLWVVITIFSGVVPGVLIYLVAIFLIPRAPESRDIKPTIIEMKSETKQEE